MLAKKKMSTANVEFTSDNVLVYVRWSSGPYYR